MRSRGKFWWSAVQRGASHFGPPLRVLSLVGLTAAGLVVIALHADTWFGVTIAVFVGAVLLAEGSFLAWRDSTEARKRLAETVRIYEASNSPTQQGIANYLRSGVEFRRRLRELSDPRFVSAIGSQITAWVADATLMFQATGVDEFATELHESALVLERDEGSQDCWLRYVERQLAVLKDMQRRLEHSERDQLVSR